MEFTNKNDTTNPNIAYVSTIADKSIPLVLCSGFLANIWIPAADTLPWAIPENNPAMAIGKHAHIKYKPCATVVSVLNWKNTSNPITNP